MFRRSPREITDRLWQEFRNLRLFLHPPPIPDGAKHARAPFPDPGPAVEICSGTPYAAALANTAEKILDHRFPLLGLEISTGPAIHWRRDYSSGIESDTRYFRRIPYLNSARVGDHKMIWELNRHQHLVLLAQAFQLTGRRDFLSEMERQLDSWLAANPFQCGINWASALEVAFRALSWMWVDHLAGLAMGAEARLRLIQGLWHHGLHLEANLSFYFSPNTHLLGEAVTLHALGRMFGATERGERWEQTGARIVETEMRRQIQNDGSHFEKSSYYHVYALDMFLFHAMLAPVSDQYRLAIEKMAEYLDVLMGPSRLLPFIGDDDGGRFFHPFGARKLFGRVTLAACGVFFKRAGWIQDQADLLEIAAWWMGLPEACPSKEPALSAFSRSFPDAGIVVMGAEDRQCLVRAGGLGPFRGGHSHADALSLVVRAGNDEILIDPGTFTYSGPERDLFRGTAAHNTVKVNDFDQATAAGPFAWAEPMQVRIADYRSDSNSDSLDVCCSSRHVVHRRRVLLLKPDLLFVLDEIHAGNGAVSVKQFWHSGVPVESRDPHRFHLGAAATLFLTCAGTVIEGWRSNAYGQKEPSPVVVCPDQGHGTVYLGAALAFSRIDGELTLAARKDEIELVLTGDRQYSASFPIEQRPVPTPSDVT